MSQARALVLLGLSLMASTVSCGSQPAPSPGCVTGQTIACACNDGIARTQTCRADHTYGACGCPDSDGGTLDVSAGDAPANDLGSLDAPPVSLDGSTQDVPATDIPTTDIPAADTPAADTPIADVPPIDAELPCPAVPIGASGGTVSCAGATVTVSAGALSTVVPIQIVPTSVTAPSGYTGYSRLFRFEPAGTAFTMPVQVTLPFAGDASRATLFWSRPTGSTGYERLGGLVSGASLSGSVAHFSSGFVGDGVDYTEPADRSCTVTRLVEGRTTSPSGIAMFFTAEDCVGRPLTDLTAADFVIKEDGTRLSSESSATLLTRVGPQVFVSLVLDVSSSTNAFLPQLTAAAGQFVTTLQTVRHLPVQIGIQVFAGEPSLTEWQAPTLDTARLLSRLDALSSYRPSDPSSTNLHGAVINALSRQSTAEAAFRTRNAGGAFTSGYVVLFTDGGDTAGLRTQAQAVAAVGASTDRMLAVGLAGGDYMPGVLTALAPGGVLTAPSVATLTREFNALANRIAAEFRTTYLLGYCSPKRAGTHSVTVEVAGGTTMPVATYGFDATGFGPGCSAATFTGACGTTDQCGGLGCGACDDRTSLCDGASRQCVNDCLTARRCGERRSPTRWGTASAATEVPGAGARASTLRPTPTTAEPAAMCAAAADRASRARARAGAGRPSAPASAVTSPTTRPTAEPAATRAASARAA